MTRKADVGRKKDLSKFLDKAPDIRDLGLRSRLNKLRDGKEFFNREGWGGGWENNNNNNNNNDGNIFLLPPPSPPRFDFPDETGQDHFQILKNF